MTRTQEPVLTKSRVPRSLSLPTHSRESYRPVIWWAALGAMFIVFESYVFVAWIASGNAKPSPHGQIPRAIHVRAVTVEIVSVILFVLVMYLLLVRPWIRAKRITLDGLFVLVFLSLYWQDPLSNFFQTYFVYNSAFLNYGSWGANIPGWLSPHGERLAEPLLVSLPVYGWCILGGVLLATEFMRRVQRRWPGLGPVGLVASCYLFCILLDILVEPILVQVVMRLYAIPGGIPWTTIGHSQFGFPMSEALLWSLAWTAWACIRYWTDDKGRTVAERGIDNVSGSPWRKTALRFLALAGLSNVVMLIVSLLLAVSPLYSASWPEDVVNSPFLPDGLCGPGTTYACPGPDVPIPLRGSSHVDPAGQLVPAPETEKGHS
jgi:Spirocyclase AveC-like